LLGDEGSLILIKAVAISKNIVHLDLSSNSITHKGARKIFQSLLYNDSLVSLKLGSTDGVHKNKVGHKGIPDLVNLLKLSHFFQYLDLKGNVLSDTGIEILCSGLMNNKILLSLNLGNNDITSSGIEELKQALLTTDLKELDISGNPLGN